MFTGIIEELGVIQEIKKGVKSSKLLTLSILKEYIVLYGLPIL